VDVVARHVTDDVELARLAEEQAALRRVATLVAHGAEPTRLFAVVAEQVARVLRVPLVSITRFEADDTATECASVSPHGEVYVVGTRWPLAGTSVLSELRASGLPARIDDYAGLEGVIAETCRRTGIRSTVGAPIRVAGRLWGAMVVSTDEPRPLPEDTEARLADFTELVGTAIANTDARAELQRLADEQAALRRVATLVARESSPTDVFSAIAEELRGLLGAGDMRMIRYHDDRTATVVASAGVVAAPVQVGTRHAIGGENVSSMVFRTGRPARIDDYAKASGPVGDLVHELGIRSAVGCPIVVEGRLWGAMIAASRGTALPAGTESGIAEFNELMATAIANVDARTELAASRARLVAAADEERRRVVRDLHDGAQQRLVHTVVTLKLARDAFERDRDDARELLAGALEEAEQAMAELRELAHGILPAVLTRGGLRAGIEALASRAPVPVEIAVEVDDLLGDVEATAYFVVAEALTNVAKHARATHATVTARVDDGILHVDVRDDGIGGARLDGSGLVGLRDRLAMLDGRLRVESAAGGGTLVAAAIPLAG
jgi:signal transduction histidine kinase